MLGSARRAVLSRRVGSRNTGIRRSALVGSVSRQGDDGPTVCASMARAVERSSRVVATARMIGRQDPRSGAGAPTSARRGVDLPGRRV